jgi:hypothetical protein
MTKMYVKWYNEKTYKETNPLNHVYGTVKEEINIIYILLSWCIIKTYLWVHCLILATYGPDPNH